MTHSEFEERCLQPYFTVWDRPFFCWLPRTLLTMEIAWLRTVLGRQRKEDGQWEFYNP